MKFVNDVVSALVKSNARKATKFVSDRMVVRAARRVYRGRKFDRRNIEVVLTVGRPNYAERKFIKVCKRAGERFPVRKVQLKHLPAR